jgi:hypothetical protein
LRTLSCGGFAAAGFLFRYFVTTAAHLGRDPDAPHFAYAAVPFQQRTHLGISYASISIETPGTVLTNNPPFAVRYADGGDDEKRLKSWPLSF